MYGEWGAVRSGRNTGGILDAGRYGSTVCRDGLQSVGGEGRIVRPSPPRSNSVLRENLNLVADEPAVIASKIDGVKPGFESCCIDLDTVFSG